MNGAQDLGGMQSFGPVVVEANEPLFHAAWERRALAITVLCGTMGEWSIDTARCAREKLPPAEYYSSSYYEIWIKGLSRLLAERGLVGDDEVAAGRSLREPRPVRRPAVNPAQLADMLSRGSPYGRPPAAPARFRLGDRVRTKVMHPKGHTRLPRYARGKVGLVERVHGVHVFPDTNAHEHGENPQWCYGIAFTAIELWGAEADAAVSVSVDCFEPYLESA